jgi:uncharacterized membrane protein YhhN
MMTASPGGMINATTMLSLVCLAAAIMLVFAEFRNWLIGKVVCKVIASTAFVLVALGLQATNSRYGQFILIALVFSWIGDVCLLSHRTRFFLSGIASFLLAHIAFALAFGTRALDIRYLLVGLVSMSCVGLFTLRWLWNHLTKDYKTAVGAYIISIVMMCSFAFALSAAIGTWVLIVGALAFAASDISVARDRFVAPGLINKVWGLPLYYAAQVLFALSVKF